MHVSRNSTVNNTATDIIAFYRKEQENRGPKILLYPCLYLPQPILMPTHALCLFFCFPGVTTHCGCIFHSPVAGFSLLLFEERRPTFGRTPLDEWSIRRRDLYLTTHNTHNRQTSMPPVGFEPTISAGERPKTYALDRTATGTGNACIIVMPNFIKRVFTWISVSSFATLHAIFTVNLDSNTFHRNKSITHSHSKSAIFPAQLSPLPRKMTHITTDKSFWLTTDWKEMVYDASRFSQSDTTFVWFSLVAATKVCCAGPNQSCRNSLVLSCLVLSEFVWLQP